MVQIPPLPLFVVAGLTVVLLSSVIAAGSGRTPRAVQVAVPGEVGERVVADGRSRLLLLDPVPSSHPGLTRIKLDGSVDRSFGDEGTVDILGEDTAVASDGKILIGTASHPRGGPGTKTDARVTRLLRDGKPDRSFGVAGSANVDFGGRYDYGEAVASAANGDILLGGIRVNSDVNRGESDFSLAVTRLRPNGSLDRSFGKNGVSILPGGGEVEVFDVAPTPSGGVVFEGGNEIEAFIWKLGRDGSIDRRFGKGGLVEVRGSRGWHGHREEILVAPGLAVLPSGRLLLAASGFVAGGPGGRFRVVAARLLPDGRVDRSYADDGWAVAKGHGWTSADGLTLLPGGVLAVATSFADNSPREHREFGAIAFRPDGHIDNRFGRHGRCRARLPGRHEAVGVVDVGGRVVVVGQGGAEQWLLGCPRLPRR